VISKSSKRFKEKAASTYTQLCTLRLDTGSVSRAVCWVSTPTSTAMADSTTAAIARKRVVVDDDGEQEGETETKRVKFEGGDDDGAEEEEENPDKEGEPEKEEPVDPRTKEIDDLAKEFGDDEEEFEVVIGPNVNVPKASADEAGGDAQQGQAGKARQENRPAFRFSASSLTAALWLPITPEQEEAMRVMGVTPNNYAHLLNPGKLNKRRTVLEDDLDEVEHPRWRDPGAVQSNFFNYGLNEQTWKEYAARQVALRLYRFQQLQQGLYVPNESNQQEDDLHAQ